MGGWMRLRGRGELLLLLHGGCSAVVGFVGVALGNSRSLLLQPLQLELNSVQRAAGHARVALRRCGRDLLLQVSKALLLHGTQLLGGVQLLQLLGRQLGGRGLLRLLRRLLSKRQLLD